MLAFNVYLSLFRSPPSVKRLAPARGAGAGNDCPRPAIFNANRPAHFSTGFSPGDSASIPDRQPAFVSSQ